MNQERFYQAREEIECPGCKRSISIQVDNCPHCELGLH